MEIRIHNKENLNSNQTMRIVYLFVKLAEIDYNN